MDYLIICIICDTDAVNKLTLQMYALHKYINVLLSKTGLLAQNLSIFSKPASAALLW